MKKKVTDWFPADVRPTIPGVYECARLEGDGDRVIRKLEWTGERWMYFENAGWSRRGDMALMLVCDDDKWRGLAEKP